MHYPNGKQFIQNTSTNNKTNKKPILNAGNRGMSFEDDINISNEYYKDHNICLITKRPTPINVVKVDYSKGAKIIDAYFEKQSTTDYNGVYKGKYIDFEAKNTQSKTSFPFSNISPHQIEHLKHVIFHDGIAFFLIRFDKLNEVYLLDAKLIINEYENGNRKSIPYVRVKQEGILVTQGYNPRLYYVDAINKKYYK